MSSYEYALRSAHWQLTGLSWRRLWSDKRFRFALLALASNLVGYALVFILTSKGVGRWHANEFVSKGMAPVGLFLNAYALTSRIWPTGDHAVKWAAWWLPSAVAGFYWMGFVSKYPFSGLECRAIAGVTMFPIDYAVKRFVVFTKSALRVEMAALVRLEDSKASFAHHLPLIRIGA